MNKLVCFLIAFCTLLFCTACESKSSTPEELLEYPDTPPPEEDDPDLGDGEKIIVDPNDINLTMQAIIDKYYTRDGKALFYLGCTTRENATTPSPESDAVLHEFSYSTPPNQFKQTQVHPEPGAWNYKPGDNWVAWARTNKKILRMHGPISPQCSDWAKMASRTAAELDQNMREFMTELCRHFNPCADVIKWMDVVNEIYAIGDMKDNVTGQVKYRVGEWFGPFTNINQFQSPWIRIGQDETTSLRVPLYIRTAFEIATVEAPDLKLIINQNGQFEPEVWENMKSLVGYLRERGLRVDGVGWQAHLDYPNWEKTPGNLERLSSFIDWCHANDLEFHITEFNIWAKPNDKDKYEDQANTFTEVIRTLLKKRRTGTVAVNFWYMWSDSKLENNRNTYRMLPWASDGSPLPAVNRIKQMLLEEAAK